MKIEEQQLYLRMGGALLAIQMLEYAMSHNVTFVLNTSREVAFQMLEENLRKTLGRLVKALCKNGNVPAPFSARLDKFVDERNWLVHRLYTENWDDLDSMPKFRALLARVDAIGREAGCLAKEIVAMSETWCFEHGVSEDEYRRGLK